MTQTLVRPQPGDQPIQVTPELMRWDHLDFRVLSLQPGERVAVDTIGQESAIVPISGAGLVRVDGQTVELARRGVFEQPGDLLYVPPGSSVTLHADSRWLVAVGRAPADGRYPVRHIAARDVKVEIRGGGAAVRQVNHLLAPPLPAERLIVFEVYLPAGAWAGWPPHRHDGVSGSPYLEETYLFRFDRARGFGFHRNYADEEYDETFAVRDLDCVAVPRGYHVTTAAPGHNMWILNFLAGTPLDEERGQSPYFDPDTTWITEDWTRGPIELPVPAPDRRGREEVA